MVVFFLCKVVICQTNFFTVMCWSDIMFCAKVLPRHQMRWKCVTLITPQSSHQPCVRGMQHSGCLAACAKNQAVLDLLCLSSSLHCHVLFLSFILLPDHVSHSSWWPRTLAQTLLQMTCYLSNGNKTLEQAIFPGGERGSWYPVIFTEKSNSLQKSVGLFMTPLGEGLWEGWEFKPVRER